MPVHHIENSKTLQDLIYINDLVVIDFSATWCEPCKKISPAYEKLANTFTNWVFTKVDVDIVPDCAENYQVTAMPTFVFIKNGSVVGRVVGADINKVIEMLQK